MILFVELRSPCAETNVVVVVAARSARAAVVSDDEVRPNMAITGCTGAPGDKGQSGGGAGRSVDAKGMGSGRASVDGCPVCVVDMVGDDDTTPTTPDDRILNAQKQQRARGDGCVVWLGSKRD